MLSRRQSLLNILDPKENCGAFRKLLRVLKGDFARAPNPFPIFTNRVARTPAPITNKDGESRNCMTTESNNVQHLSPPNLRNFV
jgi:hypothetical protein